MHDAGPTHEGDFHARALTPRHPARATRKRPRALAAGVALAALALAAGCRTPGALHAYALANTVPATAAEGAATRVLDLDPAAGSILATIPACTAAGEKVVGLAYDPFTDHLYLRLFPGNRVRVIDRPAGAEKREFTFPAPPSAGRDLALRQHDRHLFFTDPSGPSLFETSIYGAIRRRIDLKGLAAPAWGLACDERNDDFLVLPAETGDRVLRFTVHGEPAGEIVLARPVRGLSLGFDSEQRELFARLADASGIGVFAEDGRLLRTLPAPASATDDVLLDVGPRSFIRLF
jgi:hypothetical protein